MKINIFLIYILIILVLFSSCTVNSITGKITIKNTSKTAISNIYIGNKLIAKYVAPGASFDYYYFEYFEGKLKLDGIKNSIYEYFDENYSDGYKKNKWKKYINDIKLKLYTDYWIEIHIDTAKDNYAFIKEREFNQVSGINEILDNYGKYDWISSDPDDNEEIIFKRGSDYVECSITGIGQECDTSKNSWLE